MLIHTAVLSLRRRLVELRDASGVARAFISVSLTVSQPERGLLASLGPPLQGIPLRLDWADVVLFNFKSVNAQLVSAATQSSWDHVGIVFEEDGKMFLLEAQQAGVQAPELSLRLLDVLGQSAKLGLRRFVGVRSPEMRAQLWSFAVAMTGRSYKKSVGQLVGSRWGRNKADDLSSVFCSELVAAAFKHVELLDESVVTSNVLPKDLASAEFQLKRGALSPIVLYSHKVHQLQQHQTKPSGHAISWSKSSALKLSRGPSVISSGSNNSSNSNSNINSNTNDTTSADLDSDQ